jgi:hypothetical protein
MAFTPCPPSPTPVTLMVFIPLLADVFDIGTNVLAVLGTD